MIRSATTLALLLAPAVAACGYRLAATDRTVHVALSSEGAVHPDAVPSVAEALAARLRDEGLRLDADRAPAELDVVVEGTAEVPVFPAEDAEGRFAPSAWDARLSARAVLRRADGTTVELGTFLAAGDESSAATAAADDRAQASAYALASSVLARRIVAALLAAW
jgi:hypothetical protein